MRKASSFGWLFNPTVPESPIQNVMEHDVIFQEIKPFFFFFCSRDRTVISQKYGFVLVWYEHVSEVIPL